MYICTCGCVCVCVCSVRGREKSIHPNPIYHIAAEAAIRDEGLKKPKALKNRSRGWHTNSGRARRIASFSRYLSRQTRLFPVHLYHHYHHHEPHHPTPPLSSQCPSLPSHPFRFPNFYAHKGPVDFKTEYPYIDYIARTRVLRTYVYKYISIYTCTHTFVYIFHGLANWNHPIVPERPVQRDLNTTYSRPSRVVLKKKNLKYTSGESLLFITFSRIFSIKSVFRNRNTSKKKCGVFFFF